MIRVFILASRYSDQYKQKVFHDMLGASDIEIAGVCIDERQDISPFAKIRRELKRGRGGYVLVQIFKNIFRSKKESSIQSSDFFTRASVSCIHSQNLYSSETIEFINRCKPDIIFRSGFGIIRAPILSLAPYGVLSYHHGDMRKYRGQPPAFWELYNAEYEMKVTVQVLSAGLDCGAIIKEMSIPIKPDDTWSRLHDRAYSMSTRLALEAVRIRVQTKSNGLVLSESELGKIYTTPNLSQWVVLQAKVAKRIFCSRVRNIFFLNLEKSGEKKDIST